MVKTLKPALAVAAIAFVLSMPSGPVESEELLPSDCRSQPCVIDAHNQILGILAGDAVLLRPIKNQWFALKYNSLGPYQTVFFYFTSTDCTGQKYFNVGGQQSAGPLAVFLPQDAMFDGTEILIPSGSPAAVKVSSAGPGPGTLCGIYVPGSEPTLIAQPAAVGDTTVFYPPFTIKQLSRDGH